MTVSQPCNWLDLNSSLRVFVPQVPRSLPGALPWRSRRWWHVPRKTIDVCVQSILEQKIEMLPVLYLFLPQGARQLPRPFPDCGVWRRGRPG